MMIQVRPTTKVTKRSPCSLTPRLQRPSIHRDRPDERTCPVSGKKRLRNQLYRKNPFQPEQETHTTRQHIAPPTDNKGRSRSKPHDTNNSSYAATRSLLYYSTRQRTAQPVGQHKHNNKQIPADHRPHGSLTVNCCAVYVASLSTAHTWGSRMESLWILLLWHTGGGGGSPRQELSISGPKFISSPPASADIVYGKV